MFKTIFLIAIIGIFAVGVRAQTTAFTYQGSLKDGANPANGNFDLEFKLFDAVSAGAQQGSTLQRLNVAVANGIFTVTLDFGAGTLPGADRFLDIAVRTAGGGAFTTLTPRQKVNSSPYSVKSLNSSNADTATNATQLGGVAASQYVVTTDPRMTNARPPTAGSTNYIQNQDAVPQPSSNFNISGNGTVAGTLSAGTLSATSSINLGGSQVLRRSSPNILEVGDGENDSINVAGTSSLFGFSSTSGFTQIGGYINTIYGYGGTGDVIRPILLGRYARGTAQSPTFPLLNDELLVLGASGYSGGGAAWSGNPSRISFAATENWSPTGWGSRIDFHTAITGSTTSARIMSITNTGVGIRTTSPTADLHIVSNGGNIVLGDPGCPSGSTAIGFNGAFNNCLNYSIRGDGTALYINRPTGGDILFREENGSTQMRLRSGGELQLVTLGSGGATALCRNASSDISTCGSSARYKDNINNFNSGLELIRKLRPVSFNWKDGGSADMGLVAEEVNAVEPLLTSANDKGEVEGVKYDRVGVVLINAVKEQQEQIQKQQTLIEKQQAAIDKLEKRLEQVEKTQAK